MKKYFEMLAVALVLCTPLLAEEPRRGLGDECYKALHEKEGVDAATLERCRNDYITVVVSATRTDKEVALAPASVTLISRKNIDRRGVDSVAEILRDVPGIEIADAGEAGLKHVRIRGEESRRCALLIDGQEFVDQREVGTPILISPEQIERIEVVRGPASVLYGSRAIGGVVNIITRKGGYHPVQGTVGTSYDSSAKGFTEFASLFGSVEGIDYRLGVAQADFGDRDTPAGKYDNTSFENDSTSAYLGKHFGDHIVGIGWDLFNASSDVYVSPVVATTPPFRNFAINVPERDREKFSLFYDWKNPEAGVLRKVHADGYSQVADRQFDTTSQTAVTVAEVPIVTDTEISTSSRLHTYGANLQGDITPTESHLLIAGLQLTQDELNQNRVKRVSVLGHAKPDEAVLDLANQERLGIYLQDEWTFTEGWALTLGGRSDWVSSELENSTRPGLASDKTDDSRLLGSATIAYSGIEDTTLFGKYTQGFLYPSLVQLGTGAFAGPSYVNPNMDLDAETSDNFEVGVRFTPAPWNVELSVFDTSSDDYIDHVLCSSTTASCLAPAGARDRVYVNIDQARTRGLESSLSYEFERFTPYGSITWLRRTFERGDFETSDTGLPRVAARAGVRFEEKVSGNINFWADAYMRSQSDADETAETGATEHFAGWATTNLAFGIEGGSKRQYKAGVELVNLGDKLYVPSTENIAAPGRAALVRVSASF